MVRKKLDLHHAFFHDYAMLYYAHHDFPIGRLTLAGDETALTGLWIEHQKYYAAGITRDAILQPNLPIFIRTIEWLNDYFLGRMPDVHEIPIKPAGTLFRTKVWQYLCEIPYGETRTYGDIADKIGGSARAVGNAVGHNPISIIIPCHRVLGAGGTLTGYAAGINIKKQLLKHEGIIFSGNRAL